MHFRPSSRIVHHLGSLPMAFWWTILFIQNISHRNDIFCLHHDYHCFHCGALHRHLPSHPITNSLQPLKSCEDHHRNLDLRLPCSFTLSHPHADLLLHDRPHHPTTLRRFTDLQHPCAVDDSHDLRLSGVNFRAFCVSDVHYHWALHPHWINAAQNQPCSPRLIRSLRCSSPAEEDSFEDVG